MSLFLGQGHNSLPRQYQEATQARTGLLRAFSKVERVGNHIRASLSAAVRGNK